MASQNGGLLEGLFSAASNAISSVGNAVSGALKPKSAAPTYQAPPSSPPLSGEPPLTEGGRRRRRRASRGKGKSMVAGTRRRRRRHLKRA